MATLYSHRNVNKPEYGFDREVYYAQLRPLMREKNYTFNITTTPYGGSGALARKGNKLVVEVEPYVKALTYIPGQPLQTQKWKRKTIEFSPNRHAYIMVGSDPTQEHFSPYNIKGTLMSSGALSFMERVQLECLDFMIANTPAANTGSLGGDGNPQVGYAGRISYAYQLGCPNRPLILYKTREEIKDNADNVSGPKVVALDMLSECKSVLNEQSTSDIITGSPTFAIAPEMAWSRAELALAIQGQPTKGQDSSWWFAGAGEISDPKTRLGGFTHKYAENRLKPHVVASDVDGYAPAGTKSWPVIFGRQMAVAHDEEFDKSWTDIRSQQNMDSVDQRLWMYDFFALYPVMLGVAWVTTTPYSLHT